MAKSETRFACASRPRAPTHRISVHVLKILAALCCLLMTPGCWPKEPVEGPLLGGWTNTVEATRTACPSYDRKDRAEAKQRTQPPGEPEAVDPVTGKPAYSARQWQTWTDEYELSEVRKNQVLARMNREHERCRGNESAPAAKRPRSKVEGPGWMGPGGGSS